MTYFLTTLAAGNRASTYSEVRAPARPAAAMRPADRAAVHEVQLRPGRRPGPGTLLPPDRGRRRRRVSGGGVLRPPDGGDLLRRGHPGRRLVRQVSAAARVLLRFTKPRVPRGFSINPPTRSSSSPPGKQIRRGGVSLPGGTGEVRREPVLQRVLHEPVLRLDGRADVLRRGLGAGVLQEV